MYKHAKTIIRKNLLKLLAITYLVAFVLLMLTHGDVKVSDCMPYLIIYVSDIIALIFYEVFKGYLVCTKQTKIIRNGGMIGILVRIPAVLIGYYSGLGIIGFAIPCIIDFSVRAVYFHHYAVKTNDELRQFAIEKSDAS